MRISTKIIVIVSVVTVSLALSGGIITYLVTRRSIEKSVSEQQTQTAVHIQDSIDSYLYERYLDTANIATNIVIEDFLHNSSTGVDSDSIGKILAERAYSNGFWDLIVVADKAGKIVARSKGEFAIERFDEKASGSPAFDKALGGDWNYTRLIVAGETAKPNIIYAIPIRSSKEVGRPVVGVVVAYLSWEPVLEFLGETGLVKMYLLDSEGREIGRNDQRSHTEVLVSDHSKTELFQKAQKGLTIGVTSGLKDQSSYLTSFAYESGKQNYKGNGWMLFIQTPINLIYQDIFRSQLVMMAITLILAIGGSVVFWIILRVTVTKPLNVLTDGVRKITEGNLEEKVDISSNDEIGILASSFNQMVDKLSDARSVLEQRVDERTKELNVKLEELAKSNRMYEENKSAMLNLLEDARILEEDLTKERDRAQAIVNSMAEGLLVIGKDHKITLINPIAGKLLGIPAKDAIGKDWSELVKAYEGNKEIPLDNRAAVQTLENGKVVVTEIEDNHFYLTKNGRKFPISSITAPLKTQGGEIIGAVKVFRDVTQLKQLDEAKTGFISIASHQLRTPLTSMRWFSEMLIGGDAGTITEEQKHFVERIYQGTDRMISLVNLLLQIARVEAGRVKIEPVPIDLKATTNGVLLTLKTNLSSKNQSVNITCDPDPFPQIQMDQEVIWQVIQNLISNAGRYSHEGAAIGVNIKKDGENAVLSVKDTGIGIPKEFQNRIFEKFYRAENALKMVPEGSGLGLSLVKMLVDGWGGKIWFESEEGRGTTFYVTIPFSGMEAREGEVKLTV